MRQLSKVESRERWLEARALWNLWDPIGVFAIDPEWPRDEYEHYVSPTLRLLEQGSSAREIAAYLDDIATERIGLTGYPDALRFATVLLEWYAQEWLNTTDAAEDPSVS